MRKALIITAIILVTSTAVAFDTYAGTRSDRREAHQNGHVEEGPQHGGRAWQDARDLGAQQTQVRALEQRIKGNRRIDRHEARRSERAERAASRRGALERRDQERGHLWFRRWW